METKANESTSEPQSRVKPQRRGYVVEALARAGDDPEAATQLLVEWASDDAALSGLLLAAGAKQLIRSYFTDMRTSAGTIAPARVAGLSPEVAQQRTTTRIARLEFWHRYTLYGRQKLSLATRPQLTTSAELRREQAKGNLTRAKFEEMVSKRLPDDEAQVQHVLEVADLVKMATRCGVSFGGTHE